MSYPYSPPPRRGFPVWAIVLIVVAALCGLPLAGLLWVNAVVVGAVRSAVANAPKPQPPVLLVSWQRLGADGEARVRNIGPAPVYGLNTAVWHLEYEIATGERKREEGFASIPAWGDSPEWAGMPGPNDGRRVLRPGEEVALVIPARTFTELRFPVAMEISNGKDRDDPAFAKYPFIQEYQGQRQIYP